MSLASILAGLNGPVVSSPMTLDSTMSDSDEEGYDFSPSDPEDTEEEEEDEYDDEDEDFPLPNLGLRRQNAQVWKKFSGVTVFG